MLRRNSFNDLRALGTVNLEFVDLHIITALDRDFRSKIRKEEIKSKQKSLKDLVGANLIQNTLSWRSKLLMAIPVQTTIKMKDLNFRT